MSFTYPTLVSAIQAYAENDSSEFLAEMPNFIENACRTVAREVDPPGLNVIANVTTTPLSPFLALPDECLVLKNVTYNSATSRQILKNRPYDFITTYWPSTSTGGTPLFYDRYDDATLFLGPTPSGAVQCEIRYVTVDVPTSGSPESYLLDHYPELVLYRCMVEANLFMKNEADAEKWQQVYNRARDSVENEARRNRRDDTMNPIMSPKTQNTLKGER